MRFSRGFTAVLIIILCLSGLSVMAEEARKPVMVPGKNFLPLRVLVRPFSNMYKTAGGEILEENLPAFKSYFVYTRPDVKISSTAVDGWYEVGTDQRGTISGWLKAEDAMEWKQTMCLSYTHPADRLPVMMFNKVDTLRDLLKEPVEARKTKIAEYEKTIQSGTIPDDFPIISKEPNDYIDIVDQFYLLPILEYAPFEINGVESRLLKVAAATKADRGGGTLKETAAAEAAEGSVDDPEAVILKQLTMDIVYVVDMTSSMGPYIQATLDVIKNMALSVAQKSQINDSIKFGLWGYRDSVTIPGMEFDVKNFTPELQSVSDFEKTLAAVKVATSGSRDYPEDVFSGVDSAIRETKWGDNSLRIAILVGDAPGHPPGNDRNASGQSPETLRAIADNDGVYFFSLHIKDKGGSRFWDQTESQFKELATNPGAERQGSSYYAVDSTNMQAFSEASKSITGELSFILEEAKQGRMIAAPNAATTASTSTTTTSQPATDPQTSATTDEVGSKVRNLGYAALVQWIGKQKGTKAPPDITAWVTDKDLADPDIQSLDVRILLSKNELDSIKQTLQEIMAAGRRGIIGGEDFFTALQSIPSVASRSGDQIKNAKTIAESGLLPEFMTDLPYKSRIMNMSNELWASWGVDQQEEFLAEIDSKIQYYAVTHDNAKNWIKLNDGDDPSEFVYPLSLEMLP